MARSKQPPSDFPRLEAFARKYCRHVKGPLAGMPVEFEPWQREDWTLALELDPKTGLRVFRDVVMSRPKKHSKSLDTACIGLFALSPFEGENGPEGYSAAGTKEQARMVLTPAQWMLDPQKAGYSPHLADLGFRKFRNTVECTRTDGAWSVIPHDSDTIEGVNPSFASIDEYATHKTATLRDNLATAMVMREQPLMLTISTKGDRVGGPFYELEQRAVSMPTFRQVGPFKWIAEDRDAGFLFINYGLPEDSTTDIENPEVWDAINVASWVTRESLGKILHSPSTSETAFRRKHLNQWVGIGQESGIPSEVWDACTAPELVAQLRDSGAPVCVGVDLGFTDDWAAVVAAGWVGDRIAIDARLFEPPEAAGLELDVEATVGAAVDEMARRYRIRNLAADEYGAKHLMQTWARRGLPVEGFPQNPSHMCPASVDLLTVLQRVQLAHDGNRDLRQHALNAVRLDVGTRGWQFAKPRTAGGAKDRTQKIDGLVATLVAVSRLLARERQKAPEKGLTIW